MTMTPDEIRMLIAETAGVHDPADYARLMQLTELARQLEFEIANFEYEKAKRAKKVAKAYKKALRGTGRSVKEPEEKEKK